MKHAAREYSETEISAVRRNCDKVNPAIPGGCRCSFPKCWHPACAGEINGGLRAMKEKANA